MIKPRIKKYIAVVSFMLVFLLVGVYCAFAQNPPLGEAVRKKVEIKNHTLTGTGKSKIEKNQTLTPPLGEAIRAQMPKMPAAPAKEEFSLSRMQFAEAHWHGLEIVPITDQDRRQFLIPFDVKGVMVDEVTLEATQCGFLAAEVVKAVEGYPTPNLKEFLIASMRVQDRREAKFDVWRQGENLTITLKAAPYYKNLGYANMEGGEGGIPGQKLTPFDTEMFISVPPTKLSPHEMKMLKQIDATTTASPLKTRKIQGKIAATVIESPPGDSAQEPSTVQSRTAPQAQQMDSGVFPEDSPTLAWLGVEIISVNPVIAEHTGLEDVAGVLINKVHKDSPASGIGLKRGDVITRVGRIKVKDAAHLKEIIKPLEPGEEIEISVMRRGKEYTVSFFLGEGSGLRTGLGANQSKLNMLIVIAVFALVYFLIIEDIFGRMIAFPLGAVLVLVLGHKFQFYDLSQALSSINYYILMFIVGMNFTTAVLREAGFFNYLSKRITILTRGDRTKLFLFFCLLTYVVSAFMDNIATILVVVPLTLALAMDLDFNPKPLIIGVIISSNVGGASTMFGDFPNLLISLSTGLQFHDFIFYELPCCLVLLVAMFVYMRVTQVRYFTGPRHSARDIRRIPFFVKIMKEIPKAITNQKAMIKGLIVLGLIILGLIFSKPLGINPGVIAFIGGVVLLIISGIKKRRVLRLGGWEDVIFFAALFIMVGAAENSGLLLFLAEGILRLSFGHMLAIALLIMWVSAFLTAFMNAGPTAAIFIPAILHLGIMPPHYLFWWALSLGVLAGSSATLYGASGGPLASSLIGKFWKKHRKSFMQDSPLNNLKKALGFKEYLKVGGPIMIIFLVISSIYIIFLYML